VNNAVSRLAALLAVAVLGAILAGVFNHSLDGQLSELRLSAEARAQVDAARPQLASIQSADPGVQRAVATAFLGGYRTMIWIAAGLTVLGGVLAFLLIDPRRAAPSTSG
jgi:hypothetical protein